MTSGKDRTPEGKCRGRSEIPAFISAPCGCGKMPLSCRLRAATTEDAEDAEVQS